MDFSGFLKTIRCVFSGLILSLWESQNSFTAQKLATRFSATADSDGLGVASVVSSANWKVDEVHCFGSFLPKILNSRGLRPEPCGCVRPQLPGRQ